jgi:putative transposase
VTEAKPRRVGRDGMRFANRKYVDLTLAPFIGEDVVIRYDPRDIGEIRVYHEGVFLCRAVCAELSGGSYSYKEVKEMNAKGRRMLRERKREIEAAAGE